MRFGKVGSSDILGCLPRGRFLAVEVWDWKELDTALRLEGFITDGPLFKGEDNAVYSV